MEVTVDEQMLENAVYNSGFTFKCPFCGSSVKCGVDADYTYCQSCDQRIKIINPYM